MFASYNPATVNGIAMVICILALVGAVWLGHKASKWVGRQNEAVGALLFFPSILGAGCLVLKGLVACMHNAPIKAMVMLVIAAFLVFAVSAAKSPFNPRTSSNG